MPGAPRRVSEKVWSIAWLEIAVVVIAAATVTYLIRPIRASQRLLASEAQAVGVLRAIGEIQSARASANEPPAFLPTAVEGLPAEWRAGFGTKSHRDPRHVDGLFAVGRRGGYYFVIYRVDADGKAVVEGDERGLHQEWWLAYAWPVDYGPQGRRVYAIDSSQRVRYWDNDLGRFTGLLVPPPAALVRSALPKDSPLRETMHGWERTLPWKSL